MLKTLLFSTALAALAAAPCAQIPDDGKATMPNGPPTTQGGGQTALGNGVNMTVVRHWRRIPAARGNDIWGWTAPDGREFAYVGETAGIWFVETTDPQNIHQIGWWSSPTSIWRDFTNLGPYVYSVSEDHRGIRVFDMSNPDQPRDLGYVQTSAVRHTHNISADPETEHIYLSGTNQGLMVFDASLNKVNPTLVGTWNGTYTHDCCVRRGRAYLSNGRAYLARIMDATDPSRLLEIGRANTPGGYDHNVWVSEDDQLMCVTDEISRGSSSPHMTVWNIANPRAPVRLGDYDLHTIAHNVFIIGRTAYISHYTDGVHIVDLADPTNPTRVASYDTSTQPGGYNGAWGVYPFADHGLVYANDMQNGLWVFQVECGHMNRFGAGTAGTGGVIPHARFDGASPSVGASGLRLEVEGMPPNARFVLLISTRVASSTVLGVQIHVDLSRASAFDFTADQNGQASVSLPIPNDANLGGRRAYMQIVAIDPGAASGLSASRGMWAGICQ